MSLFDNKEYIKFCMYMVDGIPVVSGNAYIGMTSAEDVIRSTYPGNYEIVQAPGPFGGITVKFDNKQDEMWFKLKYG